MSATLIMLLVITAFTRSSTSDTGRKCKLDMQCEGESNPASGDIKVINDPTCIQQPSKPGPRGLRGPTGRPGRDRCTQTRSAFHVVDPVEDQPHRDLIVGNHVQSFNRTLLNYGGHWNEQTSSYHAPSDGLYAFMLSVTGCETKTSVHICHNDECKAHIWTEPPGMTSAYLSINLALRQSDRVNVQISNRNDSMYQFLTKLYSAMFAGYYVGYWNAPITV